MRPEEHYYHDLTWWQTIWAMPSGDPVVATPVRVKGHWRDHTEVYTASDGTQKTSKSIVHVDRDMAEGDFLLHGVSTETDPFEAGASRIGGWRKSSIPGQDVHVRRAYL